MTDTSREAYEKLSSKARLQREVFNFIQRKGSASNREVGYALHLELGTSSGRIRELVLKGLIEKSHKKYDEDTKTTVTVWKVKEGQLSFI